ncbi:MAG: pirin family protein [Rhodospirillaceae bacterium]|nr:pirin family protein [Rhodospirillaceae bacterium]
MSPRSSPSLDTAQAASAASGAREVVRLVAGRPASDGAGVRLTRIIGQPALPELDPFLLLDEFRADDPAAYIGGFPDHPHRGFETVTYMLAGRMRHRDNKGNEGLLGPGDVQWMTAARGIVHSEMPEQQDGLMWGYQLWLNLPARLKMGEAGYRDIPAAAIPTVELGSGASARLIAGRLGEAAGPVTGGPTDPLYVDLRLPAEAAVELPVPAGHAAFAYVYEGAGRLGTVQPVEVPRGRLAVLGDGARLRVASGMAPCRLLVIAGRPLGEPVARYGPFVMNTEAEIHQAFADFRAGRF